MGLLFFDTANNVTPRTIVAAIRPNSFIFLCVMSVFSNRFLSHLLNQNRPSSDGIKFNKCLQEEQ